MTDTPKKPLPKTGKTDIQKPAEEPEAGADTGDKSEESPGEFGGRGGADPTRFGDWEKDGRCVDF
jgi:hypothetical protein